MDDNTAQQAWWDADLQKERADEEIWNEIKGWLRDSRSFHDWLLLEMNKLERGIWQ